MRDSEIFGVKPTKGFLPTGQQFITFDAVQRCAAQECPIYSDCPYNKVGYCTVITKYLQAISDGIIKDVGKYMTQALCNKISLHLMPLFHQLIIFQMHAYTVTEPVYTTVRGQIKVHPIFEEIRKCIRAIESTQRSMGMDLEFTVAMERTMGKLGAMKKANPEDHGDPDFFDRWQRQNRSDVFPEGRASHPKLRRRTTA